MAVNIPLYPFNLGDNDLYHHLVDTYDLTGQTVYEVDQLIDEFGKVTLDEVVKEGLLTLKRDGTVVLSFAQRGTTTYEIVKFITEEVCTFKELLYKFPKNARCSSHRLKNYVAYLINFSKAQLVTLPSSAIPVIAADGREGGPEHIENKIDKVFQFADRIENRFLHQAASTEGVDEFNRQLDRTK